MYKEYSRKLFEISLILLLFLGMYFYVYSAFKFSEANDIRTYIKAITDDTYAYQFYTGGAPGFYYFIKLFSIDSLSVFIFIYSFFLTVVFLGFSVFFRNKNYYLISLIIIIFFFYIPLFDNPIKYFVSVVRQTIAMAFFFMGLKYKRLSYVFYFLSLSFHFSIFIVFYCIYKFRFSLLSKKMIFLILISLIVYPFISEIIHDRVSHYKTAESTDTIMKLILVIVFLIYIFTKNYFFPDYFKNLKYFYTLGIVVSLSAFVLPSVTDRLFVLFYFLIPVFILYSFLILLSRSFRE